MKRAIEPRIFIEELKFFENPLKIFGEFKSDIMPFFLDSSLTMEKYGRYSIIGSNPRIIVRSKNGVTEVNDKGEKTTYSGNPLPIVANIIEKFGITTDDNNSNHLPFTGGAVGYFGYDLNRQIERIPEIAIDDLRLPDIYLGFYDEAIVVDKKEHRVYALYYAPDDTVSANYEAAKHLKALAERIQHSSRVRNGQNAKCVGTATIESNFTREAYKRTILRAQEYISSGDIFQVNLAQRYSFDLVDDHFSLYCRLRKSNPAPFAAFMGYDGFSILSTSPERFIFKDKQYVETRPIKGTRPRYVDDNLNSKSMRELMESKKDAAEHIMIVDVKRNDLGKVCEYGSVQVSDLMTLENYEMVHHLVSTVSGRLRSNVGAMDLIKASFPGGSITGAPKIRAMEIIEELEPHRRNVYCGAIGYIGTNGKIDTNIAIRTITAVGKKGYLQVGGGIVADSDPDDEYEETLHKGQGIFNAISGRKGNAR